MPNPMARPNLLFSGKKDFQERSQGQQGPVACIVGSTEHTNTTSEL